MTEKWYYLFQIIYDATIKSNTFITTYKSIYKFDLSNFKIELPVGTVSHSIDDNCQKNNYTDMCVKIKDQINSTDIVDYRTDGGKNKYEVFVCVVDSIGENKILGILVRSIDKSDNLFTYIDEKGLSKNSANNVKHIDISKLCLESIIQNILPSHDISNNTTNNTTNNTSNNTSNDISNNIGNNIGIIRRLWNRITYSDKASIGTLDDIGKQPIKDKKMIDTINVEMKKLTEKLPSMTNEEKKITKENIQIMGKIVDIVEDTGKIRLSSTNKRVRFNDSEYNTDDNSGNNNTDRKSTRLNSSHPSISRMPSSA